MKINRQLASRFTVGLALATLVGTSAFAEERPSNETRRGRDTIRRERAADRSSVRRSDSSQNARRDERHVDRGRNESRSSGRDGSYRDRSSGRESRSYEGRSNNNRSNDNRSYGDRSDRNRSNNNRSYGNRSHGNRSYNHRQPYYARGRVSRVSPYRGGYRVWIGGAPHPFFVPSAYYHRNRFRIGLDIRLGGYYNPLGYYDYYDGYNSGYYDNRGYSSAELRGVVESVDYRRDTFVVRNEVSGSFVTVEMRDRRRDVRAGDYVEIEGQWTRSGLFRAYDVDLIDNGYRR